MWLRMCGWRRRLLTSPTASTGSTLIRFLDTSMISLVAFPCCHPRLIGVVIDRMILPIRLLVLMATLVVSGVLLELQWLLLKSLISFPFTDPPLLMSIVITSNDQMFHSCIDIKFLIVSTIQKCRGWNGSRIIRYFRLS